MAVRYVKEFEHPASFGFTKSAGKEHVKGYARGGHAKAPNIKTSPVGKGGANKTTAVGTGNVKYYKEGGSAKSTPFAYKDGGSVEFKYAKGGRVKGDPKDSSEERGSRGEDSLTRKESSTVKADSKRGVTPMKKGGRVKGDPKDSSEEKGDRFEYGESRSEERASNRDEKAGVTAMKRGGHVRKHDSNEVKGSRHTTMLVHSPRKEHSETVPTGTRKPFKKGGAVDKNAVKPDLYATRDKVESPAFKSGGSCSSAEFTFRKGGKVWKARPHDGDENDSGAEHNEQAVAAKKGGHMKAADAHPARGALAPDSSMGSHTDHATQGEVMHSSQPYEPPTYPGREHFATGGHNKGGHGLGHKHNPAGTGGMGRGMGALGMAAGPLVAGLGAPPGGAAGAPPALGGPSGAPPGAPPGMPMGGRPMGPPAGMPPPGMGRPPMGPPPMARPPMGAPMGMQRPPGM
jgi:hypothetical protein